MRFLIPLAGTLLFAQTLSSPVLVGLWDFPALQPDQAPSGDTAAVRADPTTSAPMIARLDATGITFAGASTHSCLWNRDLERPAMPRGCRLTESGYEIAAVGVFETREGWLRIALDDNATRFGWIERSGQFHALSDLLASNELTYMTPVWDRLMYDSPSNSESRPRPATSGVTNVNRETPYRPIGHTFVADRLWLHVELLDQVCGAVDPKVIDTGWLPAQSPAGEQWAWFWSRGC